MLKFCFIDVETTGTDCKRHGIYQLSLIIDILQENGTLITVEKHDFRVCPDESLEIDPKALEVNNANPEDFKMYDSEKTFHDKFVSILYKYKRKYDKHDKFYFVGYNAKFDADFCNELFQRVGDKYFYAIFLFPILDVAVLALPPIARQRPFMKDFKLGTVVREYGFNVDPNALHDAMYDIEITRELFYKLGYADYMGLLCDPERVQANQTGTSMTGKLLDMHEKLNVGKDVDPEPVRQPVSQPIDEDAASKLMSNTDVESVSVEPQQNAREITSKKFVITFGKHKDMTVGDIMKTNASYIVWMQKNSIRDMVFSDEIMREAIALANEQRAAYEEQKRKSNYREFEGDGKPRKRTYSGDDSVLGHFFESHLGDDCPF